MLCLTRPLHSLDLEHHAVARPARVFPSSGPPSRGRRRAAASRASTSSVLHPVWTAGAPRYVGALDPRCAGITSPTPSSTISALSPPRGQRSNDATLAVHACLPNHVLFDNLFVPPLNHVLITLFASPSNHVLFDGTSTTAGGRTTVSSGTYT